MKRDVNGVSHRHGNYFGKPKALRLKAQSISGIIVCEWDHQGIKCKYVPISTLMTGGKSPTFTGSSTSG